MYLKNLSLSILIMILIMIVSPFILSVLSLTGIFNSKKLFIFKIIIVISSFLIGGYNIGKKSKKKGYFEGLKLSIIFLIIISIFNYVILNSPINIKNLLYYSILIIAGMFGSMIGINKSKAN